MSQFWQAYGLQRTPFFQEPLAENAPGAELRRFFIGRAADLQQATTRLVHDVQTRVVVLGEPGVGKTTFLNRLIQQAQEGPNGAQWLVPDLPPINLPSAATHADFCLEVLRRALAARRQVQDAGGRGPRARRAAARARSVLVPDAVDSWEVATRAVHGATTMSPQVLGVGWASQFQVPIASAANWVPLTCRVLEALVAETGRDVLIALNNAENLSRQSAQMARAVLRDARDLFLCPRVHWILVGTPDFFEQVIAPERQVAGIMQHPLNLWPVRGARSIELEDAVGAVSRIQRELLGETLETVAWGHLVKVVLGPSGTTPVMQQFREADAVRRLAPMRQPSVHAHKKRWLADGLVRSQRHAGASEWLSVTGAALLAMWPAARAQGRSVGEMTRER